MEVALDPIGQFGRTGTRLGDERVGGAISLHRGEFGVACKPAQSQQSLVHRGARVLRGLRHFPSLVDDDFELRLVRGHELVAGAPKDFQPSGRLEGISGEIEGELVQQRPLMI